MLRNTHSCDTFDTDETFLTDRAFTPQTPGLLICRARCHTYDMSRRTRHARHVTHVMLRYHSPNLRQLAIFSCRYENLEQYRLDRHMYLLFAGNTRQSSISSFKTCKRFTIKKQAPRPHTQQSTSPEHTPSTAAFMRTMWPWFSEGAFQHAVLREVRDTRR